MTTKTQTTQTKVGFFSVRNRLILVVLLAVILPVLITQIASLLTSRVTLTGAVGDNLHTLTSGQSTSIIAVLNGQISILKTLANNDAFQDVLQARNSRYSEDAERVSEAIAIRDQRWRELVEAGEEDSLTRSVLNAPVGDELRALIDDFPAHVEVFITDAYGANVAATNLTSDYYQADEAWWQAAWSDGDGADYISPEIEFDTSANVYSVNMAVPVYSDTGETIGVLRSTYHIDALIQLVIALQFGDTGRALLADQEGRVLIAAGQSGPGEIWADLSTALNERGESHEIEEILTLTDFDGQSVVVDSAPLNTGGILPAIDNLGWIYVITQTEAEAFAPINEAINASTVVTAIVALIGVGIAFVFSRALTNPLQQLTEAAQRLGVAGDLTTRVTVEGRDEFGILGRAFNAMADQVQASIGGLETRVAERTQDLMQTIEVGRLSTSIRSQEELLPQLVEFIRSRFDLYFTQIYLLDEAGRYANLRAGTGDVGAELLAKKHRLDMAETSIVARTVRNGEPVLVSNTERSAIHKMNPLLPDTRSEVAIPLVVGGEILGVLDMQATEADTFNEGNLPVFRAMAAQIASALQSARAYDEAQAAVARAEAMNQRLASDAWQPYLGKMARGEKAGYQYELESPKPLEEDLPRADTQATEEDLLMQPLAVSGQTIGSIVVKDDRAHTWSEEEQALVEGVSERLALALDRFRSFDETEAARQEVERIFNRLDLTLEGAEIGLWDWDLTTNEVIYDDRWHRLVGYEPGELEPHFSTFETLLHPDDLPAVEAELNPHLAGETESYEVEMRLKTKAGDYLWTLAHGKVIERDKDGKPLRITGTQMDIHERMLQQEELADVTRMQQAILDGAEYGIISTALDGTVTTYNRATETLFGYTADEVVGKLTPAIWHDLDEIGRRAQELSEELGETVEPGFGVFTALPSRGMVEQGEWTFTHKDGSKFPGLLTVSALHDDAGNLRGVLGIIMDITARKQAEAEIARRAVEMETVAQVTTAATTTLDMDELLQSVVDLTKERFDLYHAHIYLLDEAGETLVLTAGAGDAGKIMVEGGHSIPLNREGSIVATVARTHEGAIVNDVTQAPNFMANPLLPDTKAEMAVPMIIGDTLVGVLDVQANTTDRFDEHDIQIKSTLAGQIATAVQNARTFQQVETARQEVERIFSTSIDMIGSSNFEGYFVSLNPAWEETMGHTVEELMSEPFVSFVHPDDVEATTAETAKMAEGALVLAFENRYRCKDGTYKWISWRATPDFESGLIHFVARDVTESKQAEERLRETAEQLSDALTAARLAYWEFDYTTGNFTFNDEFYNLIGTSIEQEGSYLMPAEEFATRFNHPDDIEDVGKNIQQAYETDDPNFAMEFESRSIRGNGDHAIDLVKFRVVKDENGQTIKLIGANQDITTRKQAEEQLRERALELSRLTALMDNANDLVGIANMEGKAIYTNPAGMALLGRKPDEWRTMSIADYHPPETNQRINDEYLAIMMKEGVWSGEFLVQHRDGHVIPVSQALIRVNDLDGEVIGIGTIIRDITESKLAAEEIQRRAVEMETVAQVTTAATTTLDMDELLQSVVEMSKERFDLYHVHIYLLDESGENLVLTAGAGEAGKTMVEEGHSILLSREGSMVATAARTGEGVISNDVTQAPNFMANPLLPDTKAEMAVPMIIGDTLVGVLDVQANTTDRFDEHDIQIKSTLAGQIATAVQNARTFQQVETARQEVERIFSTSIDMIGSSNFEGYFVSLNPAWEETMGYTIEELKSEPFVSFVHPDDVEATTAETAKMAEGALVLAFENRYRCKDGTYKWISWRATPDFESGLIHFVARDVTESKQQQELLHENEARLAEATNAARIAYWEYDYRTSIFTVSDEWYALLGMTAAAHGGYELTPEDLVEKYIHPADAEKVGQQVQMAYESEEPNYSATEEFRFLSADGEVKVHLARFRPIKDEAGQTIGLTGANQDITESKRAAEEIQRRAAEMETVAQVSTAATTTLDMGELLQSVVDLTKERFGLYHAHVYLLDEAEENLVLAAGAGQAGKMMVGGGHSIPLNREGSMVATAARIREGVISNDVTQAPNFMPNPLLPKTKSEMAIPMIVGDRLIGMLDVQADITGRFTEQDVQIQSTLAGQIATAVQNARSFEQTQSALAQTEALYTGSDRVVRATTMQDVLMAVVESTVIQKLDRANIMLFDEIWHDTPRMDTVGTVYAVWEHDGGELRAPVGTDYPVSRFPMLAQLRPNEALVVKDAENDARVDENFHDLLINQLQMRSIVFLPLVAGGEWIGLLTAQSAQAMPFSADDVRQMDSLADQASNVIQTLRLIEQQQETVERLTEVDRLKQQFLANMSHELRTPLNSIIGYSEVLLDGVDGDLTEDAEEDVEAIHDSGKHLLSIINEILDLAKIEAGQMQLDAQSVDLPQFIKDIVHSGQILVKDKDVALESVEQSKVPTIEADPIRVRQVLWNLISNAVKFTETGGVTVTYGMHSDTEVFVKVQDTGIGMSEEGVASIFERFSQVDGSSTRRAGGTGLGLTITRQLVRMHGGEVYVESEVGVGSTFLFTLPIKVAEKA